MRGSVLEGVSDVQVSDSVGTRGSVAETVLFVALLIEGESVVLHLLDSDVLSEGGSLREALSSMD